VHTRERFAWFADVLFVIFANLGDSSSARAPCCPAPGQSGDDRCCFVGAPRPISSSSSVPSVPFTMHDAYDYKPVLEKLPLHIEAIACYGNVLLLHLRRTCVICSPKH